MPLLPQIERELAEAEERLLARRSRSRPGRRWRFGRPSLGAIMVASSAILAVAIAGFAITVLRHARTGAGSSNRSSLRASLPAPGAPRTLLVIGSDHQPGKRYLAANTDTIMLVRLDAGSSTVNVLSIPPDLAVDLPDGHGSTSRQKLNAAYSIGGPNLLIQTLKHQVLPGLVVNHVLDVNFAGFPDLVDAMGCVYAQVDSRYYTRTAVTKGQSIDVQPGYQKLCGNQALQFVRYRHTAGDIVRDARLRDFVRWAEDGHSLRQVLENKDALLKSFGAYVRTDRTLHTVEGVTGLFDLFVNIYGHAVRSIPFPVVFGPCGNGPTPCYEYATRTGDERAYQALLTPTVGMPNSLAPTPASDHGLTADPGEGKSQAVELGQIGMPVLYPTLINTGSQYCSSITGNCDQAQQPRSAYDGSYPRTYTIDGTYAAYALTVVINPALGQYYTVQGTTWQHPPILSHPSAVTTADGKTLYEYADGSHLAIVALHTPHGVYWIANTLTNQIPNPEMIAIAASLRPNA